MEKQPGQNKDSGGEAQIFVEEAWAQAPMLLAGKDGNCRGEVRVWTPDRRRIQCATAVASTVTAVLLALSLAHPTGRYSPVWTAIPVLMFYFFVTELRRRCVVMTDSVGIAIASRGYQRAFQWENIQAAEWDNASTFFHAAILAYRNIYLAVPTTVECKFEPDFIYPYGRTITYKLQGHIGIYLAGYTVQTQRELFELIIAKANLRKEPGNPDRYSRRGDPAVPIHKSRASK